MVQKKIELLDCTLRDGGNINNCKFGKLTIRQIITGLAEAGVDIVEIGFIRDEEYNHERSVYTKSDDIKNILKDLPTQNIKLAAMIEGKENLQDWFPIERMGKPKESGLDFFRVYVWERLLEEHMEYCKKMCDLGYMISVQPTAVTHYNDKRFIKLLKLVNEVEPYALYIVDTWGTESPAKIRHFAELADEYLKATIKIGYHGHNNKMQALACADAVLSMELSHDLCIDSTIGGMGKGSGNLQTEVIMDYLIENYEKKYNIEKIYELYAKYIDKFTKQEAWGYSLYHFIGSRNLITQYYASYFKKMNYGMNVFYKFIMSLNNHEKGLFSAEFVENRLHELGLK